MTLPKKQDLDRILKFCATSSRSAPSPPLRRGEVYCLSSFTRRAEQWFKEEAGRQLNMRSRQAAAVGKRRQPSRAAKGSFEPGDYVLSENEVDLLLLSAASPDHSDERGDQKAEAAEARLPTPPSDDTEDTDGDVPQNGEPPGKEIQSPEACLSNFRSRLGMAIHTKGQELRAQHDRDGGIRHTCTLGGSGWDCVDEEYCGHGLVDRCVRWVPKGKAYLRARVRFEMEEFFSSSGNDNNNTPERLAELKRARAAALKAETVRRMEDIEARLLSATSAAAEAEMLESPTLGRWPEESQGFLREDVEAQRVELAGLVFAVDVCLGEPRVLML